MNSPQRSTLPRRHANLAHQASTAALTTARSLTSHLRRHYHTRYKGKYRFSKLVFGFDLFLVGFAAALFIFLAAIVLEGTRTADPGMDVSVSTAAIRASDDTPVEIRLRVTDRQNHQDVRIVWHPPEWVDVVSSDPAISKAGIIFVGAFRPGEERSIRMRLRVRALAGSKIPFDFLLRQSGIFGFDRISDIRAGERLVRSSALHADPVVDAGAIVSDGSYPLAVTNEGSATTTLATLRLTAHDGAPDASFSTGGSFLSLSNIAPGERRIVFVDLGATSATSVRLAWELQDGAQAVFDGEKALAVATDIPVQIQEPLRWIRGQTEASVAFVNGSTPERIFVAHPLLRDASPDVPFRMFALGPVGGTLRLPLDVSRTTSATQWSVVPVEDSAEGSVIGKRTTGLISSTIPFKTDVRYYTALGDQIGIGPMPPKVGERTDLWIVWSVGPMETDLTDLVLKTTLPSQVTAVGKFASAIAGTFLADGPGVTWTIPVLAATKGEPVTFAFEVELLPTRDMKNALAMIVGESFAEARDVQTGEILEATAPGQTTDLPSDQKAKGKGVVQ